MEDIKKIEGELKILKEDLMQFFSAVDDKQLNEDFYDKVLTYSSKNPEFISILKLLTVLSSKNETELKQYKIKIFKILERLINLKEKSINILTAQHNLYNEIQTTIGEIKGKSNKFFSVVNLIFKSKILMSVFGFSFVVVLFFTVNYFFPSYHNDLLKILKIFF